VPGLDVLLEKASEVMVGDVRGNAEKTERKRIERPCGVEHDVMLARSLSRSS